MLCVQSDIYGALHPSVNWRVELESAVSGFGLETTRVRVCYINIRDLVAKLLCWVKKTKLKAVSQFIDRL